MAAETHHETLRDLQTDSDFFLEQLELASDHPHEALIVMQTGLNIDIGQRVGFYPGTTKDDPELVRATKLSSLQYEKIKSLEELVGIYVEHGIRTHTPRQLGKWFDTLHTAMDVSRPIDVLFDEFNGDGFHPDSIREVSKVASAFLKASGYDAIWARWG